jgi:hypothetical protein
MDRPLPLLTVAEGEANSTLKLLTTHSSVLRSFVLVQ